MPLTAHMRQSIDDIRNYLYGGGYPDPVSNAEQLSFLFFFYLVEGIDAENRARARFLKKPYSSLFDGTWELKNPLNAAAGLAAHDGSGGTSVLSTATVIPRERFRWSIWAKGLSGESLVRFVRDEVFAFFADAHNLQTIMLLVGRNEAMRCHFVAKLNPAQSSLRVCHTGGL